MMSKPVSDLAIAWWPITKPIPYARNARLCPEAAIAKVAASLKEFGFRQPIVVDGDGVVIAGHTRLLAAQRLGLARVPVHVARDLTPQQVKAYRLADNRTAQETSWDLELLPLEIAELADLGYDLDVLGFDPEELTSSARASRRSVSSTPTRCPSRRPSRSPGPATSGSSETIACSAATPPRPTTWLA